MMNNSPACHIKIFIWSLTLIVMLSVSMRIGYAQSSPDNDPAAGNRQPVSAESDNNGSQRSYIQEGEFYYLQEKISSGGATLEEIQRALSYGVDIASLTNIMHAFYSMRWHRGVINLLDDLWKNNQSKYPELAWDALDTVPVRIALASTITRIRIFETVEFKDFIREHRYDEHEFHRAQAAISLALNGDPVDVPYIKEMADGENVYVAQSAITALALMAHPQAEQALRDLAPKYSDDQRGILIREVLEKAYPGTLP
jgi:hypothetical protein